MQFEIVQFAGHVSFLDLEVYRNLAGEWHTRLFFKTTDVHAYLLPQSAHPEHMIRNIPKSVAKRARRACSETAVYREMKQVFIGGFFRKRHYETKLVKSAFHSDAEE